MNITKKLKLLLVLTAIILLVSMGLPMAALPSRHTLAAPSNFWTQTTIEDFSNGDLFQVRTVIWDPGNPLDDGNVILDSRVDQENWGPSRAPSTPKIYGDNYLAQTFLAGKSGANITITLYLARHGSPEDLVIELRTCVGDDPVTTIPGTTPETVIASATIPGLEIPLEGVFDVGLVVTTPHISAGTSYAIVLYQYQQGGGASDYYSWWYDGDYENGNAWKQSSDQSGWQGAKGFGGHDATFKIYINDEPNGKGYYPEGTLTSSIYDAGEPAIFENISWSATEPPGTSLKFQIATNNDGSTWDFLGWDGTPGTYYETSGSAIWPGHIGDQYIRYKAYLETSDSNETPVLHDITMAYSPLVEPTAAIDIEKSTNGVDADITPGPGIVVGWTVNWEYVVTNTGNVPLTDVTVSDDIIGSISTIGVLLVGESVTCSAAGTAIAGQYENYATAAGSYNGTTVTDSDYSHYFGINLIHGTVFDDTNGNGLIDSGENGIQGVSISLDDAEFTITDINGQYEFADVATGSHTVKETDKAGYFSTTPNTVFVDVEPGENEVNFGDAPIAEPFSVISGTVFEDNDVDGVHDTGEPGVGGVTLTITGTSIVDPDTVITNGLGQYTFRIDTTGTYTVTEIDLLGYVSTNAIPGGPFATKIDANTLQVEVDSIGIGLEGNDFGDVLASEVITISGRVWEDNGDGLGHMANGQFDDDETGLGGAIVWLSSGMSQTTGYDGNHSGSFMLYAPAGQEITVRELNPGSYKVKPLPPSGYTFDHWETEGDITIHDIVGQGGEYWYCYVGGPGVIRMVLNPPGTVTSIEPSLPTGLTLASSPLSAITFDTVPANTGTIEFADAIYNDGGATEIAVSYMSTNAIPGNDATKVDNDTLVVAPLTGGSISEGNLFGDVPLASTAIISGTVFDDEDENGTFGGSEAGIPDITVTMEIDGGGSVSVNTDSNGDYQFAVAPGTYVRISSSGPGGDYYPTTPESVILRPLAGGLYPNNNFGYSDDSDGAAIYGTVFDDADEDGQWDAGELGIAGVTVTLDDTVTTTTDSHGAYSFPITAAGTHTVEETNPHGYYSTTPDTVQVPVVLGNSNQVDFGDSDDIELSIDDVTVSEDGGNAIFTVSLNSPSSLPVTVDYSTVDGTATAGSDYTATWGTLAFAPGETSKTISVPIIDDLLHEGDETFYLDLFNPTNATILDPQGIGTIVDSDQQPMLSIDDVIVSEDGGNAIFTVSLNSPS
ncbi:SdrD B-like domain-containing protein, partial [Chloroflexota bacterium]